MGIIEGVKEILTDDGLFIFEVSYLLDVYEKILFDTIYHEHLAYHSVKPLDKFFKNNGMELIDVKRISTHGGSIRGVVQLKNGSRKVEDSVEKQILIEEEKRIDKMSTFMDFSLKIESIKKELNNTLLSLKKKIKKLLVLELQQKRLP